jgi:hypothetical protein
VRVISPAKSGRCGKLNLCSIDSWPSPKQSQVDVFLHCTRRFASASANFQGALFQFQSWNFRSISAFSESQSGCWEE